MILAFIISKKYILSKFLDKSHPKFWSFLTEANLLNCYMPIAILANFKILHGFWNLATGCIVTRPSNIEANYQNLENKFPLCFLDGPAIGIPEIGR